MAKVHSFWGLGGKRQKNEPLIKTRDTARRTLAVCDACSPQGALLGCHDRSGSSRVDRRAMVTTITALVLTGIQGVTHTWNLPTLETGLRGIMCNGIPYNMGPGESKTASALRSSGCCCCRPCPPDVTHSKTKSKHRVELDRTPRATSPQLHPRHRTTKNISQIIFPTLSCNALSVPSTRTL